VVKIVCGKEARTSRYRSDVRKNKRKAEVHPSMVRTQRIATVALVRMFWIGVVAVGASSYAVYRYYVRPRPTMFEIAPGATEIPAPSLEPDEPRPASSHP
jgi:hypothetical protein